jgi:hypothetical protein
LLIILKSSDFNTVNITSTEGGGLFLFAFKSPIDVTTAIRDPSGEGGWESPHLSPLPGPLLRQWPYPGLAPGAIYLTAFQAGFNLSALQIGIKKDTAPRTFCCTLWSQQRSGARRSLNTLKRIFKLRSNSTQERRENRELPGI